MLQRRTLLVTAMMIFGLCSAALAAEQPSILLIMVDDLGYHDLGCQGVQDFKTPNIDRLAESGVRFTAGYVTAPQCGPSRAGLLTGMHQSRFGCTDPEAQLRRSRQQPDGASGEARFAEP